MSDNFGNNDYDSYFKTLEKNLEKSRADKTEHPEKADTRVAPTLKKKRKKGVYKVVRLRKSAVAAVALVLILICGSSLLGNIKSSAGTEKNTESENKISAADQKEKEVEKTVFTFSDETPDIPSSNDAQYAIIIDKRDNTVVAARNADVKAYPASTTKIMTVLTAVDLITDYSDTFTMTLHITDPLFVEGASVAGFLDGEEVNMTDLLYGTILPSGADAAMGLAVKLAGSEENFVKLMNKKVKELGLKNTHFDNVTGLHSENNYSTAYDMAVILDAAMQNEICKKVLSTYQYTTAVTPQHPEGILLSSTLFTYMYGNEPVTATILGGKTGFVNESGYCIASYGENNENGNEYIVVTLGNSARMPAFFGQIDLYKEFAK